MREAVLEAFASRAGVPEALEQARDDVRTAQATVPQAAAAILEAAGLGDAAPVPPQ